MAIIERNIRMTDTIEHRIMMGDEQAFELLYRRYFVRLCAFANKFLNDPQLSEEAVQEWSLALPLLQDIISS